jgi:hypothetical protein
MFRLNRAFTRAVIVGLGLLLAGRAHADSITYDIKDIGTFSSYTDTQTSDTFTGTGFVGLYGSTEGSISFAHLFGIEHSDYSHTALNVDVSGLAGSTINGAFLDFTLLNGYPETQSVTATSFDANGTLAYSFNPPSNLGFLTFPVNGLADNSLDVTPLLASRVGVGNNWFGLYLNGSSLYQWTYTYSGYGYNADSAKVRLVVDYTPGEVPDTPEPNSLVLLATGGLPLLGYLRRRKLA